MHVGLRLGLMWRFSFWYCLSAAVGCILSGLALAWLSVFNRITNLSDAAAERRVCVCYICFCAFLLMLVHKPTHLCRSVSFWAPL